MGRGRRPWVHQDEGCYHLMSRIVGEQRLMKDAEKEYFMTRMMILARGFFIKIHNFAILDNHFHILCTSQEREAREASSQDLVKRYKKMFGKTAEHPIGSKTKTNEWILDEDGGIERLRARLGSLAEFVKELKQGFSRWYNKKNNRKGTLWSDRYKSVIVDHGRGAVCVGAYIDLNPVRADIVDIPEDYRWCTLGFRARNGKWRSRWLHLPTFEKVDEIWTGLTTTFKVNPSRALQAECFREFVYQNGLIKKEGKGHIPAPLAKIVKDGRGQMGIGDTLLYHCRNISEGIALGSFGFIKNLQELNKRKFIRPRPFCSSPLLYSTRNLSKRK